MKQNKIHWSDSIPAVSGLIGKIALISSFAIMWAGALNITHPDFVFENVRNEIIIGSVISLVAVWIWPSAAPAGTLAPLIVMVPAMSAFGAHPFILSILTGVIGIVFVKTKLLGRLLTLSGPIAKTSLALYFGISGIKMSAEKLTAFFGDNTMPLIVLMGLIAAVYIYLLRQKKAWAIIPVAAAVSLAVPLLSGISIGISAPHAPPNFSPDYWWNTMWGIGYGLDGMTILKTLPFALFVMLLWAVDTASIQSIRDAHCKKGPDTQCIDLEKSFITASFRNMASGICGGAQTASLWRSFLIPIFMMKRPMRTAAVLMCILGIISGLAAYPVQILSFPPLIWSVLLFGIFMPFLMAGLKNILAAASAGNKIGIGALAFAGLLLSPIVTWAGAVVLERIYRNKKSKDNTARSSG